MSSVHLQPHSRAGEAPTPQVKEVSPGIFAYVQLDGSWGLNNPTFLLGRKGVTLVDTCFTEQRGRNLRAGQTSKWTRTWFHDQGLHQLMGTVRYPKAA